MEIVSTQSYRILPILIIPFFLFVGLLYSNIVSATINSQPPGTQLAYFVGTHAYHGGHYRSHKAYYGHRYNRYNRYRNYNNYWTNWGYINYGCRKRCLIDSWSGAIIRCSTRCY